MSCVLSPRLSVSVRVRPCSSHEQTVFAANVYERIGFAVTINRSGAVPK
jgi:hypothetical protein